LEELCVATQPHTVYATGRSVTVVAWHNLANSDTGTPYVAPFAARKTVQVWGTFGTGGLVQIEGTLNPHTPQYVALNDTAGNTIVAGTARIRSIENNSYLIRPRVTAGDGTTALVVEVMFEAP
jgi:hypothetical protein